MFKKTVEEVIHSTGLGEQDSSMISPLVLAYIGDSVYELFVRTYLITNYNYSSHQLHLKAVDFVKAGAQANIIHSLFDFLTDDEIRVVKRGRNAKSLSIPKNVDVIDYRHATGLECLIGYLYIKGRVNRLMEILGKSVEIIEG